MPFALPFGVAVVAAITVAVLVGLAIERFTLRPMTGQPLLAIILVTLGLAQLLEGTTTLLLAHSRKDSRHPSTAAV